MLPEGDIEEGHPAFIIVDDELPHPTYGKMEDLEAFQIALDITKFLDLEVGLSHAKLVEKI